MKLKVNEGKVYNILLFEEYQYIFSMKYNNAILTYMYTHLTLDMKTKKTTKVGDYFV